MESEPVQKKMKMSGEKASTSGEGEASSANRRKAWHESKNLLKLVALLLNDPHIIPEDISFVVGASRSSCSKRFGGHKIFFALRSPVFHSMFYEKSRMKEISCGFIAMPDVTLEAFKCLKTYVYTDSFAPITVDNVIDVLTASQKYLMTKLTRYCYQFVQENLKPETALFFWIKARSAMVEIVQKQSIAETKRNGSRVVMSNDFLKLPEEMILELTSWDDFNISEVDLYQAVKKWRTHQEKAGRQVQFNRTEDGILQHIRFALFSTKRIAAEEASDSILSSDDFRELILHNEVGKELTIFNANHRAPVTPSFRLSLSFLGSNDQYSLGSPKVKNTKWECFVNIILVIWPDVAPKACKLLRQYVESDYHIEASLMIDPQHNFTHTYDRLIRKEGSVKKAIWHSLPPEALQDIETSSALWSTPNFVCLKFSEKAPYIPELTVLNTNLTYLGGKLPESVFEDASQFGVVIGKVLDGPIDRARLLAAFEYRTLEDNPFDCPTAFDCVLVDD